MFTAIKTKLYLKVPYHHCLYNRWFIMSLRKADVGPGRAVTGEHRVARLTNEPEIVGVNSDMEHQLPQVMSRDASPISPQTNNIAAARTVITAFRTSGTSLSWVCSRH